MHYYQLWLLEVVLLVALIKHLDCAGPIWDVTTSCSIPNEATPGLCQDADECLAYQRINSLSDLASIGRLSFVKAVQCSGLSEGKVCCPRKSATYRLPTLNESLPQRIAVGSRTMGGEQCGQPKFSVKLYGGQIAEIDEFPWAALLIYDGSAKPTCGGSLISKNFIVTAGHCLVGSIIQRNGNLKFIRLGEYDLNNDPDCMIEEGFKDCTDGKMDFKPKKIIIHPDYNPNNHHQHHDIGLVELEKPAPFTLFIQHICLPEPSIANAIKSGTKLNVCGWGRTNFFRSEFGDNVLSPVKLKVALPYVEKQNCQQVYGMNKLNLHKGQMCAGGTVAKDSCAGDSGSPLMLFDRVKGHWVLAGLVSLGEHKCGTPDRPGIYTNVQEYVNWIKQNARI